MHKARACSAFSLGLLVTLIGCGGGSSSSSSSSPVEPWTGWKGGGTTSLKGVAAFKNTTATLDLAVAASYSPGPGPAAPAASVVVSGTITVDGVTYTVGGTFGTGLPQISVYTYPVLGGNAYSFDGWEENGVFIGTWAGNGTWAAIPAGSGRTISRFFGQFAATSGGSEHGTVATVMSLPDGTLGGAYAADPTYWPTEYGVMAGTAVPTTASTGTFSAQCIRPPVGPTLGSVTNGNYSLSASPSGTLSADYSLSSDATAGTLSAHN